MNSLLTDENTLPGLTEEMRDQLIRHLVEQENCNPFRLVDILARMGNRSYWEFNAVAWGYTQPQQIFIERLWKTMYPDAGCETMLDAVNSIAVACYVNRTNGNLLGRLSGEEDLVDCYVTTDLALAWIASQMPALTMLQALGADRYKYAKLTDQEVIAACKESLIYGVPDRERWIGEWWQYQMRYFSYRYERDVQLAVAAAVEQGGRKGGAGDAHAAGLAP